VSIILDNIKEMKKQQFENKKLDDIENFSSIKSALQRKWSRKNQIKTLLIIIGIALIIFIGTMIIKGAQKIIKPIQNSTIEIVGKTVGDPMTYDEFGNINILLIGFG